MRIVLIGSSQTDQLQFPPTVEARLSHLKMPEARLENAIQVLSDCTDISLARDEFAFHRDAYKNQLIRLSNLPTIYLYYDGFVTYSYWLSEVDTTRPWTIVSEHLVGECIKYLSPKDNYEIVDPTICYAELR